MSEESRTNPAAEDLKEDEINLLQLLQVIVRRRMLIFKVCTVVVVLSVCYSLTLNNIYTATSTFYPPPRESSLGAFASLLVQASPLQGLGGMSGSGDLYLAVFKSRTVGDAVVKRLDLQKEYKAKNSEAARKTAQSSVKAVLGKDGLITVSADSKDPQKAAQLANAFVDEMIKRSVQLYVSKAGTERSFLEKRLEAAKVELKNAESDLKTFQEKHKTIKADAQASVAIEGIARLKAEIVVKEVQLATLRNSMTDESGEVKALQAGISQLKSQMGAMTGSGGGDSIIPATGNVPSIGVEYVRKLRELKTQELIFEQLSKQYELAKINETKDSSSIQIIDEAVPPINKSKPKRKIIVVLSTITAFFISIVVIFIQEYLSKLSPEDAEIISEIRQSFRFRKREA
jgi:tyrosine-protein kinase Etk/Wzc